MQNLSILYEMQKSIFCKKKKKKKKWKYQFAIC